MTDADHDTARRRAARAAAGEPKGPAPYHGATPQKASAASPLGPEQPRRLDLADLKRAFEERKAASQSSCG